MKHKLKIEEQHLKQKLDGNKLFEIRVNDRGYQKGDFTEYEANNERDETIKYVFEITYVTNFMQKENFVVFQEHFIGTAD